MLRHSARRLRLNIATCTNLIRRLGKAARRSLAASFTKARIRRSTANTYFMNRTAVSFGLTIPMSRIYTPRAKDISHTIFDDLNNDGQADRTLIEGDLIPRINGINVGVIASLAEDEHGNMYGVDVFQLRAYRITSADINFDGRLDDVDIDLLATGGQQVTWTAR